MKENEIRPDKVFSKFLELAKADTETYFSNVERQEVQCPACKNSGEYTFTKNKFKYCKCEECKTLYVNPLPDEKAFISYYTNSPSSKFWATTFYKETAEARREKIWKPKAYLIKSLLKERNSLDSQIIDVGGGYGIFSEEMQKIISQPITIIEPAPHLSNICSEKGFNVIQKFLEDVEVEDLPNSKKCFVSFELFEHLHNPENFLLKLNELMNSKDLFILTTLSSMGLDIQVLWENSPSVSPPHHLNFFNPESIKTILARTGFEQIEVSTPGKLDIDILINNKKNINDGFWRTFIETASEAAKESWQINVTNSGWSSHMMVICQKK